MEKGGQVVLRSTREGRLYKVELATEEQSRTSWASERRPVTAEILHCRLGHLNYADLFKMVKDAKTPGRKVEELDYIGEEPKQKCQSCIASNMCRQSHPNVASNPATDILDRVHMDI